VEHQKLTQSFPKKLCNWLEKDGWLNPYDEMIKAFQIEGKAPKKGFESAEEKAKRMISDSDRILEEKYGKK